MSCVDLFFQNQSIISVTMKEIIFLAQYYVNYLKEYTEILKRRLGPNLMKYQILQTFLTTNVGRSIII